MTTVDYLTLSTDDLLALCVTRGITLPLNDLDDREHIITILRSLEVAETRDLTPLIVGPPTQQMEQIPIAQTEDIPEESASAKNLRKHVVTIVKNYEKKPKKRSIDDFIKMFNARYKALSSILRQRKELQDVVGIARTLGKKDRENVAIIGMVVEKRETKNKYIILTVEDQTGQTEVWIGPNNRELSETVKEVAFDQVLGFIGTTSDRGIFANHIIFPDVPPSNPLKKGVTDTHVVFVGDVEVGSKLFMREEFEKVILWLSGQVGTPEQRATAQKVGYVIFIGDLVHGVGIYPNQQNDSDIHDIKDQYREFARYIKMIPDHIQIIMISGNHDAGRLQEPQLPVYRDFAEDLYAMPNVHILSNPCTVNIEKTATHPGFDILLYHGYSLVYYATNIQPIKDAGGMKATQEVMKLYLKMRHLSPTHGCNTYVPDAEEDPMVIDKVPDFLVTGHIHDVAYANYKGVTVLNCGAWNDVSDEQIKRGLEPQPGKLPVVNLRTRELRIMNFYSDERRKSVEAKKEALL